MLKILPKCLTVPSNKVVHCKYYISLNVINFTLYYLLKKYISLSPIILFASLSLNYTNLDLIFFFLMWDKIPRYDLIFVVISKKLYEKCFRIFVTFFIKKNRCIILVLYTYCSFSISVYFYWIFETYFYERLRVIPVRIITVTYTYHILLTFPTIKNSKIHPHAKCKIK